MQSASKADHSTNGRIRKSLAAFWRRPGRHRPRTSDSTTHQPSPRPLARRLLLPRQKHYRILSAGHFAAVERSAIAGPVPDQPFPALSSAVHGLVAPPSRRLSWGRPRPHRRRQNTPTTNVGKEQQRESPQECAGELNSRENGRPEGGTLQPRRGGTGKPGTAVPGKSGRVEQVPNGTARVPTHL